MNYISISQLKHSLGILETLFQIFPLLLEELCVSHFDGLEVKKWGHSVLFGHFIRKQITEDTDDQSTHCISSFAR